MPKAVSLNDVAGMLSTRGDISTIGGAIGCISAMISGDARDKENTTSNDIKKIQEFILGDGGSLSSMIDSIHEAIADQTIEIQKIIEGNREKKLVKSDISKMIKTATDGLEKRLDQIIDSLRKIGKDQGGSMKWGKTKKEKDSIEQFRLSLNDKKKMKESKIGKLVSMLSELKVVSLKDLLTFRPKIKLLDNLNPQINSLAKNINSKNVAKVSDFLEKSPKMFENLNLSIKLARFIKQKELDKFYDILGVGDKKKPKKRSILGLLTSFGELNEATLDKSKKNVATVFKMVRDICSGVAVLVVATPVILAAGILSKPLEWALFGFSKKGDGGIMGLLTKLSKKRKTIRNANEAIVSMSIGFVALGAGLGLLFTLTKKIEWVQLARVAATTVVFGTLTTLLGKFKKPIKTGVESMLMLSAGMAGLGIGLGLLFKLTKGVDWEQMAIVGTSVLGFGLIAATFGKFDRTIQKGSIAMVMMSLGITTLGLGMGVLFGLTKNITWKQMAVVGASMAMLGVVTLGLGVINKTGMVVEGAIAMGVLGLALIPFGLSMKLLMSSVRGLKWSEFGMFASTTLLLGGAVIGVGALMCTGLGAIAWTAGLAAIGGLGLALIPFGKGMQQVSKAAKGVDNKAIENLVDSAKNIIVTLSSAATRKERRNARKNARLMKSIGGSLNGVAKSLKTFNEVSSSSIEKAIDSIKKISEFFFGEKGMTKYGLDWKKRVKAKKEADTIGQVSNIMHRLSTGLKIFNEVAPSSIDKAMDAVKKIAEFFFSPNSGLNKLNASWSNRRKARKTSDTIVQISNCIFKLSKGLKDFNEVSESSISKAKKAIHSIAHYFFSPSSSLNKMNVDWMKRKKGKKNADAIGAIGDSMYKISKALKEFNEIGDKAVNRMMDSVDKIANYFFDNKKKVNTGKSWKIQRSMEYIADGLSYFDDKTKDIDSKRLLENFDVFNKVSSQILDKWKTDYRDTATDINKSMSILVNSFNDAGSKYRKSVKATTTLFKQMSNPNFAASGKTMRIASNFVRSVNAVDIDRASSLTDMFKSFASIGKAGNVFSRFDKRVKQFTEACIELVNAINGNTEALNNSDEVVTVKNEFGEQETVKRKDAELMPKQMVILNVGDLANAIAEQLNSLSVDCDANINLQINSESGNEWRISRT